MEHSKEREDMVQYQLAARGIRNERVLEAMRRVPRHEFVPDTVRPKAYDDMALPIGEGQTISQPYMVALMTELLALKGDEKVLEVGTGSGYQAAILAELAREVFTMELHAGLQERARGVLERLGYRNIYFRTGDGSLGLPEEAPFQAIMVTAGSPEVPKALVEQLDEGGRIVAPVGGRYSQRLVMGVKHHGVLQTRHSIECVFVPLLGEYGFKE